MEFLLGLIVGATGIFWLFFWLGTSPRFKNYDVGGPADRNLYHPHPPCTDGHKWCEDHAKLQQFHCTACGYVMQPGE